MRIRVLASHCHGAALVVCTAALALFHPTAVHAAEVTCLPDYDFAVEVDGEYPHNARFYRSEIRGSFFIDVPAFENGLLMDLKAKMISAIPRHLITMGSDVLKFQDSLPADTPTYAFSVNGPVIRFEAENRKVRIVRVLDRPALVGNITIEDLLADRQEYSVAMDLYVPDETAMRAVKAFDKPVVIDVYFGTWCPHCKKYMPKILRVARESGNGNIKFNMVGVPKGFGSETGPWSNKNIRTIPTVIVSQGGKEITRLNTHESAIPELELAEIFKTLP